MKTVLIFSYIGLILMLCLVGTIDSVVYAQEGLAKWFPYILIFVAQPIVLYLLLKPLPFTVAKVSPDFMRSGIVAASVLIVSLVYIYYLEVKGDNDLHLYGKTTRGIVYKKWHDTSREKANWLVRCTYIVDGHTFSTFSETDKENKYKIGDTLTIRYSSRYPQNCIIEELNEK
jgi:steroid 5-alpha reductase family enzyme